MSTSKTIKSGSVRVRGPGAFASRKWAAKWLVLTEQALLIYKAKGSSQASTTLPVQDISTVERIDLEPYCLLLVSKGKQYHLSFASDKEVSDWQDDIYNQSHSQSGPTNFVHHVHVGFDTGAGGLTGMPDQWHKILLSPTSEVTQEDYAKGHQDVVNMIRANPHPNSTSKATKEAKQKENKKAKGMIQSGSFRVKDGEGWRFSSRTGKLRWLALTEQALSIHRSKDSPPQKTIALRDISVIERNTLTPHCLLVITKGRRYYLSFTSDEDLYEWQEDIYSHSGMAGAVSGFVHKAHAHVDPRTGKFMGLPEGWSKQLGSQEPEKHAAFL